jgi:putative PIN family toxin of toxin-antitoxin system
MRVVLDTNVLVSAMRSNLGASYALVASLPSTQFEIALSVPLYVEYQDVLTRPEHLISGVTREQRLAFLRYLASIAWHQDIFYLWRPWLSDPKDEMVLELAVAANCQYIVTANGKDFRNIESFGVTVIKPSDLLRLLCPLQRMTT